jgi:hypothetical protein
VFVLGFRRHPGVAVGMQSIPRELNVKRLAGLLILLHELLCPLGHAENVDRVRVGELERMLVAGVAVAFAVAVAFRTAAADMPLAVVGRGISSLRE